MEILALLGLLVPSAKEVLLGTEVSPVLMASQDLRVLKEIVALLVHRVPKVPQGTPAVQGSLVYQVQGALLVPQVSRGRKASQGRWVHRVKMDAQAQQDRLVIEAL